MDSTFDITNPNIYHANATLGGGVLGGSIAGLEYDENGNATGFSAEKFLAGFIAGGITSKATQAALKSPKLRQKALDFSDKAGEIISRTLKESNLPKHAQNALEIALGKRLANALDSRAWINEPKEAIKSLEKDTQELATISNQNPNNDKITPQNPQGQNTMQIKQNQNGDYLLKDSDGKSHIVRKDLAQEWIKEFGLKTLNDDFLPNFQPKIRDILSQNGADEIHLKIGSLFKLEANHRIKYLDRIKPTLENPNTIIKQNDGALIFVKDFKEKKFFTSVSRDKNGEWVITSNAPKSLNNVKNKIKEGGKILYNELAELETIKINANDFTLLADSQKQQTTK